jgi:integrase
MILTALDQSRRVDADFRDIGKLLFLTGLRRDEVADLKWSEIDLDSATVLVSGARMKNHKDHLVPLSNEALSILRERHDRLDPGNPRVTVFGRLDTGFSGFSKAKRRFDEAVAASNDDKPIASWTLHDIRRFVSTTLHERLGVQPHVVEAVLAHLPKGVAGAYNRSQYATEKRRALDKLANHLRVLEAGATPGGKVIQLSKRPQ